MKNFFNIGQRGFVVKLYDPNGRVDPRWIKENDVWTKERAAARVFTGQESAEAFKRNFLRRLPLSELKIVSERV